MLSLSWKLCTYFWPTNNHATLFSTFSCTNAFRHKCRSAYLHMRHCPPIDSDLKRAQTQAASSTDPDNTSTQTTANAIGWVLLGNIFFHCCRGNSRKVRTEMGEVWFRGRDWARENTEDEEGIADTDYFITAGIILMSSGDENPGFLRQSPGVFWCVWEMLNMAVCSHAMCSVSTCAQCISVTVTNCKAWVLWGNPGHLWMTHEKALISQQRGRTERRRRMGMRDVGGWRAEICPTSMPPPPHSQSWLRKIMLPSLHWHIWDRFISLCL